jgi:PAS domain S-box-containing protein
METNSDIKKLTLRLLLAGISLAVIIVLSGYFFFLNVKEKIKEEKYHELTAIGKLKVDQIVSWREERLGDAKVLSSNQSFITDLKLHFSHESDSIDHNRVFKWLSVLNNTYKYHSIYVVDKNLKIRFSTFQNDSIDKNDLLFFQNSIKSKQIIFTDLHKEGDGEIRLNIVVPLFLTNDKELVGVIVLRIDPTTFLFPLIQTWPTPSKTSETLILRKEGDHVLFLNELHHQKNTAHNLKIPLTRTEIPAVQAALGTTGIFEGNDYRGVRVISSLSGIPNTNWFMVAKVDKDEIFESINRQAFFIFSFVFILIILIGVGILIISRQQLKHVRNEYQIVLVKQALQKHFEYLIKYANDIIILSDYDGNIIETNDAAVNAYGYTKDELLKLSPITLRAPETRDAYEQTKKQIIEKNGLLFETIHQKKDGTKFYVEVSARPIEIENKKYIQRIIRDITDRKLAEESLKKSETRLRTIFEAAPVPLLISKVSDGTIIMANERLGELFQILVEDLIGKKSPHFYYNPDDRKELLKDITKDGYVNDREVYVKKADGTPFWCLVSLKLMTFSNEQALLVGFNDITERKRIEIRERNRSCILEYIVEGVPLPTILDFIVSTVEAEDPTSLCSILLLDDEGKYLLHGAAPSLPDFYNQAIDGLEIGDGVGSCGTAAYTKQRVVVDDILTHPYWIPFRELAQKANLRSCWSEPIISSQGKVLGTFAIYHRESVSPEEEEIKQLKITVDFASLAIERRRTEKEIIKHRGHLEELVAERTRELTISEQRLQESIRDISDYKLALDESSIVAITDQKGIIKYANDNFCKISKYSRDELIGQDHRIINSGFHPKEFFLNLWVTIANGKIWRGEIKNKAKDGTIYWVDSTIVPFLNEDGKPYQYVAIRSDITERRELELEFKKLHESVERCDVTVIITDTNGNIEYVNPYFVSQSSYSREESLGQNPRILNSGYHPKEYFNNLWDTIRSGNVWHGEFRNRKKNGEIYWEQATISPIKNSQGIITHFASFQVDITELRKAQTELVKAKEAADSANRAKSEFLANMSHEIRTPMNAIIGFSDLLSNSVKEAKQLSQIESIRSSGKNLLRIINDILDISKIEADKIEIEPSPVNLAKLASEVENMFIQKVKEKGIYFAVEYESVLPKALLLDEVRLRQILFNLIGNAVKFTDKGHVTLTLDVRKNLETKENYDLTIRVEDTGIGIPADQQEVIFQPFSQQTGQSSIKYGGTGLGLTITKKLVEKMGGSISVESNVGTGSSFMVVLSNVPATDVETETGQEAFDPSLVLLY